MSGQVSGVMLVACHDCGEVHRVPGLEDGRTAVCARCGGVLLRHRVASIERALALNLAALLLFGVANLFPVMTMRLGGRAEAATLLEGVTALYRDGMWGLAGVVLLAAILIPLLKLIGSIWVLAQTYAGRRPRLLAPVFRLVGLLHPWAMTEVYLLGLVVAWVKLRDLATIELGTALFALVGLILLMIWADAALEPHEVWERVAPQTRAAPGEDPAEGSFLACHGCRQLVPAAELADQHHASCPRCGTPLHHRKPESLVRTSALLLTAAILYVPANLLPVMTVVSLGEGEPDTILSGVKALAAVGMWPVRPARVLRQHHRALPEDDRAQLSSGLGRPPLDPAAAGSDGDVPADRDGRPLVDGRRLHDLDPGSTGEPRPARHDPARTWCRCLRRCRDPHHARLPGLRPAADLGCGGEPE